jgi:hypothetical protein
MDISYCTRANGPATTQVFRSLSPYTINLRYAGPSCRRLVARTTAQSDTGEAFTDRTQRPLFDPATLLCEAWEIISEIMISVQGRDV